MNNNNQKKGAKKQPKPKSAVLAKRAPRKPREEGIARLIRQPLIGMPDLMSHCVSWICGSVYIGNGTLGATDSVYFLTPTGTYTYAGLVPVLGSDAQFGASYVKAIDQLYRRKVYRAIRIKFQAIQSATTNNMTLTVAPVRGPPGSSETGKGSTGTLAALTQTTIMSMQGSKSCSSFENTMLDLTPFIAGGSGAKQNEFQIASVDNDTTDVILNQIDLYGVCPTAFAVAGNSTVSALRGTKTHLIIAETVCDYLDFQGAKTVEDPLAAAVKCASCEEKARMLKPINSTKGLTPF